MAGSRKGRAPAESRVYGAPRDPSRGREGARGGGARKYGDQADAQEPQTKKEDPSPPSRVVEQFHRNADTDVRRESIHHTLGPSSSQASPGDHTHDGGSSKALLEGVVLTGSKANPTTMWPSIIQALVRLGAKDSTTS